MERILYNKELVFDKNKANEKSAAVFNTSFQRLLFKNKRIGMFLLMLICCFNIFFTLNQYMIKVKSSKINTCIIITNNKKYSFAETPYGKAIQHITKDIYKKIENNQEPLKQQIIF